MNRRANILVSIGLIPESVQYLPKYIACFLIFIIRKISKINKLDLRQKYEKDLHTCRDLKILRELMLKSHFQIFLN